MKALLFVSALLLMVRATPTKGYNFNLNIVYHLALNISKNSYNETYVEDLSALIDSNNRCTGQFFCKTYDILKSNLKIDLSQEERLLRNLKMYVDKRIPNCVEPQKNATSTAPIKKPLSGLLENLANCIKKLNIGATTTHPDTGPH